MKPAPAASDFGNTLGVLSILDAYDSDRNVLWENQAFALQRIASDPTVPDLCELWEHHYLLLYPELYEGVSFLDWISFLKNCNLIESDGSLVRLTANGHDFLSLLACNAPQAQTHRVMHERWRLST
jgi:hypothetical protein